MEWFKETIELKSTLTTALGPVLNQAPVFDLYKFMTIMNVKAGIDTQHFSSSYNFTWAKFSNSVPTVWYLDNVTKWHVHVMCHTGCSRDWRQARVYLTTWPSVMCDSQWCTSSVCHNVTYCHANYRLAAAFRIILNVKTVFYCLLYLSWAEQNNQTIMFVMQNMKP